MKQFKNHFKTLRYIYSHEECLYEMAQANARIFPIFTLLCSFFLATQFIYDFYFFITKDYNIFHALYLFVYLLCFLLMVTTNRSIKKAQKNLLQHIDDIMDSIDRFSIIFLICFTCISLLDIFTTGTLQSLTIGCMALSFLYFRPRKILPTFALTCILVYLFSAAYRGISFSKCNILFHNFITTTLLFSFILLKYYLKTNWELSKKECQKYRERLNQATLSKTKFLANVTHYLEVPTHNITSTANTLNSLSTEDDLHQQLLEISTASEEIACFINNIKELNSLDSNHTILNTDTLHLPAFLKSIEQIFQVACKAKNQKLVFNIHDIRHPYVYTDFFHLKQIFMNILMNAVSYTPIGGCIHVTACELEDMTGVVPRYQFIIEDDGIGMSEDFVAKIYYPFERAEDIVLNEVSGAGIGMTVVRQLLDLLHGSIDVSSIPNVGTEITFSLDLQIAKEPEKTEEETVSASSEIAS